MTSKSFKEYLEKQLSEVQMDEVEKEAKKDKDLEKLIHEFSLKLKSFQEQIEAIFGQIPDEIEIRVKSTIDKWIKYFGKKPHKCPVCDGKSKIQFTLPAGGYWEDQCKSCQGTGIVWG